MKNTLIIIGIINIFLGFLGLTYEKFYLRGHWSSVSIEETLVLLISGIVLISIGYQKK